MRNTPAVYPLTVLAVFGACVLWLVHAGRQPAIDICVSGDIHARDQARVPAELVDTYLDAERIQFGLGALAIGDWRGLGDGLVAGGRAWVRTTHTASPQYYSLVASRYFQTLFLVYVPTGTHPVSTWRVAPGSRVSQLWQALAQRYPSGVILEGYAHLRTLRTIAIAQPAVAGRSLGDSSPHYYTQPMESRRDVWIYAVGYVHDPRGLARGQTTEASRLLFSPLQHEGGQTHALILRQAPEPGHAPSIDNGVNVGQLLGTSEFIEGQFRLYPIRGNAGCKDAIVGR